MPGSRPHRDGPRPLPVHLMASSGFYMSSIAASLALKSGSIAWSPELRAEAADLTARLANLPNEKPPPNESPVPRSQPGKKPPGRKQAPSGAAPENRPDAEFRIAVELEARRRVGAMLRGIETYRDHPYRRQVAPPATLLREGTTRVLDYRPFRTGRKRLCPVVLIPSLVNRAYILDLREEQSLARWLSARGHSVFLIDWDAPGPEEQGFSLEDYIARLRRALRAITAECGEPAAAIGYCMGGLLALAAAQGVPEHVRALVFMATPWDFHADRPDQAKALASLLPGLEAGMALSGEMAVDVLQTFFMALDPVLGVKKFAAFSRWDPHSNRALGFVALEDWLNDGVPLTAPVARECIGDWFGENRPAYGAWRVDGAAILPEAWEKPALSLIPAEDRIVPPKSARSLADALPNGQVLTPAAGHIGMVAAQSSVVRVWEPLAAFLQAPEG